MPNFAYDAGGNMTARRVSALLAPQITGQPVRQVAGPGDIVTFSVVVADAYEAKFQWKFNSADIPSATGDSLLLTDVTSLDEGQYSVVVTNSAGSVTSTPASLMLDFDGDGLPDSWEITNFGNTSQRSAGDPDADGISNLDEFLDGTNPNNNLSFRPRLKVYGGPGGGVTATPMKLSYDLSETVTITAISFAPSVFVGWIGDLNSSSNPATITMADNRTVRARFAVPAPIPPGLIALWRGETDANDLISGQHGAFFAGTVVTTPTVTAAGKVGGAFSFDGTVHVRVPDSAVLKPPHVTVEAWVFPTASNLGTIIARGTSTNNFDSWCLRLSVSAPEFASHNNNILRGPSIPLNEWTHLVATFNGVNCRLYVNGFQVDARGEVSALVYDADPVPVTIGSDWIGSLSSALFKGLIDEIALYNRALTSNEILAIYNADFLGKDFSQPYFPAPAQLPDGVLGVGYSQQVVVVLGTGPLRFSISSGVLPPGMTLSPTGLLSGVPSAPGVFSFTVHVIDAAGASVEQRCVLQIFASVQAPAGLVGWWRAENDASDSAGTNHGVLRNGAGFASGRVGQAFSLDGVDDCIEIPDAAPLQPTSVTLETWVAFDIVSGQQVILAKPRSNGTSDSYALWLEFGTLKGSARDAPLSAHFSPVPGRWYHLAYTVDAAAQQQVLYVDGIQVASGTSASPIAYDAEPLLLGRGQFAGAPINFLHGRIDEAAIYNRALNGVEIASIFNAGAAGKHP